MVAHDCLRPWGNNLQVTNRHTTSQQLKDKRKMLIFWQRIHTQSWLYILLFIVIQYTCLQSITLLLQSHSNKMCMLCAIINVRQPNTLTWDRMLVIHRYIFTPKTTCLLLSAITEQNRQLSVQSTSTPHPRGKGRRGYLVIDCTYCAHHPSNPHRSHLGLVGARGHVRRSPALRTGPSRSTRTRRRPHRDYPRTPRSHTCGGCFFV